MNCLKRSELPNAGMSGVEQQCRKCLIAAIWKAPKTQKSPSGELDDAQCVYYGYPLGMRGTQATPRPPPLTLPVSTAD